jgi:hypothetical protein
LVGPLVLNAIIAPLPVEVGLNSAALGPPSASTSDIDSPVVTSPTGRSRLPIPRRALDRLTAVLKNSQISDPNNNRPNPVTYPVEVRANVCALLEQAGRSASGEQMERLNEVTKSLLEDLVKTAGPGREGMLGVAAKKTLDGWAKPQIK